MKMTKLTSFILILTVAVFLANGWTGDLPVGAIARIDVGEGPINAIAYSRSTNRIAVAAASNIHIYDASTYKKQMVFTEHTDSVLAVAFSPNGKLLISGGLDKTVRLWNADTGKLRRTREEHKAPVNTVAFSPDGKRFWSASSENDTIRSWYPRDGGRWSSQTSPRTNLTLMALACSYKGANVAKVFDGTPSQCLIELVGSHWHVVSGHTDPVSVLTLYEDGKTLATGSADKTIELWNTADTSKPLYTLTGHTGGITAMDFSVDAKLLASGSSDKTVRLWDLTTGQSIQTFTGHTSEVGAVIFLEDKALAGIALAKAKTLASGDSDGTVFIWNPDKIVSTD